MFQIHHVRFSDKIIHQYKLITTTNSARLFWTEDMKKLLLVVLSVHFKAIMRVQTE